MGYIGPSNAGKTQPLEVEIQIDTAQMTRIISAITIDNNTSYGKEESKKSTFFTIYLDKSGKAIIFAHRFGRPGRKWWM